MIETDRIQVNLTVTLHEKKQSKFIKPKGIESVTYAQLQEAMEATGNKSKFDECSGQGKDLNFQAPLPRYFGHKVTSHCRKPDRNSLLRQKTSKEIIINHKVTRMVKNDKIITDYKRPVGNIQANYKTFSGSANSDVVRLISNRN